MAEQYKTKERVLVAIGRNWDELKAGNSLRILDEYVAQQTAAKDATIAELQTQLRIADERVTEQRRLREVDRADGIREAAQRLRTAADLFTTAAAREWVSEAAEICESLAQQQPGAISKRPDLRNVREALLILGRRWGEIKDDLPGPGEIAQLEALEEKADEILRECVQQQHGATISEGDLNEVNKAIVEAGFSLDAVSPANCIRSLATAHKIRLDHIADLEQQLAAAKQSNPPLAEVLDAHSKVVAKLEHQLSAALKDRFDVGTIQEWLQRNRTGVLLCFRHGEIELGEPSLNSLRAIAAERQNL